MDSDAYFFWAVLAALVLASLVLRSLEADRIADRWSAAKASGRKLVHATQRGGIEVAVWVVGGSGGPVEEHTVTVNQDNPACGDCMKCVNQAIHWIEHQNQALDPRDVVNAPLQHDTRARVVRVGGAAGTARSH